MSTGIVLSFAALFFWSISPFCFAATGRSIGPFATNFFRLLFASVVLGLILLGQRLLGNVIIFPHLQAFLWFAASGVAGLAIGDFFLYRGLASIGPEKTSQIMVLSPAITAALAWMVLKETLHFYHIMGMVLVLFGVSIATWDAVKKNKNTIKNGEQNSRASAKGPASTKMDLWFNGTGAGIFSALFQSIGTLAARQGFLLQHNLDPIMATSIRIGIGAFCVLILARWQGAIKPMWQSTKTPGVIKLLLIGTAAGPVIGMICYVGGLKYAPAGIVTTITFMTPLIVIPLGARMYRTRIGPLAIVGTAVSLVGVCFLGFSKN